MGVEDEGDKIRTREREGGSLSYRENINRQEKCYGNGFVIILLYGVLRYALFGSTIWKANASEMLLLTIWKLVTVLHQPREQVGKVAIAHPGVAL